MMQLPFVGKTHGAIFIRGALEDFAQRRARPRGRDERRIDARDGFHLVAHFIRQAAKVHQPRDRTSPARTCVRTTPASRTCAIFLPYGSGCRKLKMRSSVAMRLTIGCTPRACVSRSSRAAISNSVMPGRTARIAVSIAFGAQTGSPRDSARLLRAARLARSRAISPDRSIAPGKAPSAASFKPRVNFATASDSLRTTARL